MTIPASQIVAVNPNVLSAGGNALAINGVVLTKNTVVPTSSVLSFDSETSVASYFGSGSDEDNAATVYFNGFDNSSIKPGTIYFAPYVDADRAAWIRSGSLSGMTLTALQALSGTLIVTVDGTAFTSSTINLATATSFSNAATMITAGFTGTGKPTCTWNATLSEFVLTSSTTGATSTMTFATGTLSTSLKFTSATGAVLSQGDVADTPATAMANVVANTHNWATFTTIFEPLIADKVAFAVWSSAQNSRYLYVCWDTDAQAIVNGATTPFGVVAKASTYDGTMAVYNTLATAMFVLGAFASVNWSEKNGRITISCKTQSGFTPTVTDEQTSSNLLANGYSYYGSYATANDQFNFFYNGQLTGKWKWADTFVDQVYLNSQLQLALMDLLTNVKAIPYNDAGYALIRAAMMDPVDEALNCGVIRKGVSLSDAQKAEIINAAGKDVTSEIQNNGYYIQILDPTAQIRQARGTPVINFWWTDGGAVQKISLASIDIL